MMDTPLTWVCENITGSMCQIWTQSSALTTAWRTKYHEAIVLSQEFSLCFQWLNWDLGDSQKKRLRYSLALLLLETLPVTNSKLKCEYFSPVTPSCYKKLPVSGLKTGEHKRVKREKWISDQIAAAGFWSLWQLNVQ